MTTFKQYMEAGLSDLSRVPTHAAPLTPPNRALLGPEKYEKARNKWEIDVMAKFDELIRLSDDKTAKLQNSPIIHSQGGRYWIPITIVRDTVTGQTRTINNTPWHSEAFTMLVDRGIISRSTSTTTVIDARMQPPKAYAAGELAEVYPDINRRMLKKESEAYRLLDKLKGWGDQWIDKARERLLQPAYGTDIFGK